MTKNKSLGYDRYVISDMFPISILDMDTGDSWPLADEGIFETVCELLNKQDSENYQLKQPYADVKKDVGKQLDGHSQDITMSYDELDFILRTFRDLHKLSYSEILLIEKFCDMLKSEEDLIFMKKNEGC